MLRRSSRPARSTCLTLVLALVALIAASCGGSAAPAPSFPTGSIIVTAKNRAFDTKELRVPADTAVTLVFVNEESDLHNIAIRTQSGFDGDLIFRFDPVSIKTVVLRVDPIPKGSYFFLCEIHPAMSGTVVAG
jgi:plastocyanin